MLTRVLIVLVCVVVFITGCNSLVSQLTGTHRLRSYSMEEVELAGVGDADYVEIRGAWQTGDFLYGEPRKEDQRGIIQYPLLSEYRLQEYEKGGPVPVRVIAWEAEFDPPCLADTSCAEKQEVVLRGLVREVPDRGNRLSALDDHGYQLAERPVFIEAYREPMAWYWNVAMMTGAALLALAVEWRQLTGQKSN